MWENLLFYSHIYFVRSPEENNIYTCQKILTCFNKKLELWDFFFHTFKNWKNDVFFVNCGLQKTKILLSEFEDFLELFFFVHVPLPSSGFLGKKDPQHGIKKPTNHKKQNIFFSNVVKRFRIFPFEKKNKSIFTSLWKVKNTI